MEIAIKFLNGRNYPLTVEPSQTILQIKEILMQKEGIPTDKQKVYCCKKLLEDEKTLQELNIQRDATFNIIVDRNY